MRLVGTEQIPLAELTPEFVRERVEKASAEQFALALDPRAVSDSLERFPEAADARHRRGRLTRLLSGHRDQLEPAVHRSACTHRTNRHNSARNAIRSGSRRASSRIFGSSRIASLSHPRARSTLPINASQHARS